MDQKVIHLKNYPKKSNKAKNYKKMFFVTIIAGLLSGLFIWNIFIERIDDLNVEIPASKNLTFNDKKPLAMTTAQIANEFENADGKPILLYIYATWCKTCSKNFSAFNEIAREFQNTDLQIIAIAIDRDLNSEKLQNYLNHFGDLYFQPRFLIFKDGFLEFLRKRSVHYDQRIPFTALFAENGKVISKFSGIKSKNYLRRKIIKLI